MPDIFEREKDVELVQLNPEYPTLQTHKPKDNSQGTQKPLFFNIEVFFYQNNST